MKPGLRSRRPSLFFFVIFLSIVSNLTAQIRVDRRVQLMGTDVTLEIYSETRNRGLDSLEQLVSTLEDAEAELSTWQTDSILTQLNSAPVGGPFQVEATVCRLVAQMILWHSLTGGAFDPAVGALIQAWDLHGEGRIPTADELDEARHNSGFAHLQLDGLDDGPAGACLLTRMRDIQIDVGGFGKGEGLDRVRGLSNGIAGGTIDNWMINLGGQVMVQGSPPEQSWWEVQLAHPIDRTRPVRTLRLTSGSLATSGGSENDIRQGDQRLGHILDPRTGKTVVSDVSVAVWHRDALVADIVSTALYVMGVDQGLAWAEEQGIAAGFHIPRGDAVDIKASSLFEQAFGSED